MTSNLQSRFFEATVRIEQLIFVPGCGIFEALSEQVRDLIIDDLYGPNNEHIAAKLPALGKLLRSEDAPEEDDISEALHGVTGYFAELARPVPSGFISEDEDAGFYFSWGHYQTKWFYVETMEELAEVAEHFSKDVVARARQKRVAA